MKKLLLIPFVVLLLVACNHSKTPKTTPNPSQTTTPAKADSMEQPVSSMEVNPDTPAFVRDTTAPLGSPQNPIKIEPGKPIDFSTIFKNNQESRSFGENAATKIDSISKLAAAGDINGMFLYGTCYEQGWGVKQDYGKAFEWYKKAAEHGQKNAFGAIGGLYRVGHGVASDPKQAYEWFKKGAEHRDDNSMLCLGNCYYLGFGTEKNLKEAAYWWDKAANDGNGFALSQMGDAYYGGLGVEKDIDKAVQYYKAAVAKNISNAQYRLGVLYYYGQGVRQHADSSLFLVSKAREQGVELAREFINKHFPDHQ